MIPHWVIVVRVCPAVLNRTSGVNTPDLSEWTDQTKDRMILSVWASYFVCFTDIQVQVVNYFWTHHSVPLLKLWTVLTERWPGLSCLRVRPTLVGWLMAFWSYRGQFLFITGWASLLYHASHRGLKFYSCQHSGRWMAHSLGCTCHLH